MSDTRHIHWSQLRIGQATTLLVALAALLIFFIDEARDAIEPRYALHFHTLTTQVLRPRSPVWLAGQPVGHVARLVLEPPARASRERLRVELAIRRSAQPFLSEGATVQVITASLLGEAVVNLLPAAAPGALLPDGAELPVARGLDPSQVLEQLQSVSASVRPVWERWREVQQLAENGPGTLARLRARPDEIRAIEASLSGIAATLDTLTRAAGGLASVLADAEVRAALGRIGPRLATLEERWSAGAGSIGGIASDTLLAARLASIGAAISRIDERLERGQGTLGRLLHDQALRDEASRAREMLDALKADLRAFTRGSRPPR
jgi:phospholipid/cholesterol/gamma-HCH transport system substrate-binding protein